MKTQNAKDIIESFCEKIVDPHETSLTDEISKKVKRLVQILNERASKGQR